MTKLFRITTSVKKVAISNLSANAYQQTLFKTNLPFIALNPLEQSRNFLVVIFDSRGKRVFSQKGLANMLIPDKFKSGIYYLSVSDNNGVLLKRQFVIDR
ncbi:MAG: T9SS type A sorting domain-containing protein [Chitinivibrionales bacterium]